MQSIEYSFHMTHMIWGNTTEIFVTILHTLILLIKKYYLDFHDWRTFVAICFHWDVHTFWHCLGLKSDFRQFYEIQNLMSNHVLQELNMTGKGNTHQVPDQEFQYPIIPDWFNIWNQFPNPNPNPTQFFPIPKSDPTRQPLLINS